MNQGIFELIHDISTISSIETIAENDLSVLKLKAIELLSAYAMEKSKNKNLWRWSVVSSPDFNAFFSTDPDTNQTSLTFRQDLNVSMHYSFSTAKDIIVAMNHLFGNSLNNEMNSTLKK